MKKKKSNRKPRNNGCCHPVRVGANMWSRRDKKSAWNPSGYERVVADRGSWHYQRCRGTGTEDTVPPWFDGTPSSLEGQARGLGPYPTGSTQRIEVRTKLLIVYPVMV